MSESSFIFRLVRRDQFIFPSLAKVQNPLCSPLKRDRDPGSQTSCFPPGYPGKISATELHHFQPGRHVSTLPLSLALFLLPPHPPKPSLPHTLCPFPTNKLSSLSFPDIPPPPPSPDTAPCQPPLQRPFSLSFYLLLSPPPLSSLQAWALGPHRQKEREKES